MNNNTGMSPNGNAIKGNGATPLRCRNKFTCLTTCATGCAAKSCVEPAVGEIVAIAATPQELPAYKEGGVVTSTERLVTGEEYSEAIQKIVARIGTPEAKRERRLYMLNEMLTEAKQDLDLALAKQLPMEVYKHGEAVTHLEELLNYVTQ